MARKNQKLINYHTGKKTEMPIGSNVDYGEIVVRHNAEAPELLIKIGDDSFGVFQASGAVQTAIDSVSSATKTLVSDVSAATVATYATKEELKSTSGSIISDYTPAIGAAKKAVYDSATTVAAADAKTKADTAYSSAVTAAAASANTLQNNINTVNSSVTGLSASTVNIETTANSAIQTASIVDKDTCKVSVNKVDKELQFDFSNLVVDCGDF